MTPEQRQAIAEAWRERKPTGGEVGAAFAEWVEEVVAPIIERPLTEELDAARASLAVLLRTEIHPDDDQYGTSCDWGQCANEAKFWRVDPRTAHELPVCADCAIKDDDAWRVRAESAEAALRGIHAIVRVTDISDKTKLIGDLAAVLCLSDKNPAVRAAAASPEETK